MDRVLIRTHGSGKFMVVVEYDAQLYNMLGYACITVVHGCGGSVNCCTLYVGEERADSILSMPAPFPSYTKNWKK